MCHAHVGSHFFPSSFFLAAAFAPAAAGPAAAVLHVANAHALIHAGVESVSLSNLILHSTDSFPDHAIDLASLLRPSHLAGSSGAAAVNLTNVMLLHDVPSAQAAVAIATLRGVVSDPIVQRGIAAWTLQLYTVRAELIHSSCWCLCACAHVGRSNGTVDKTNQQA